MAAAWLRLGDGGRRRDYRTYLSDSDWAFIFVVF
jgi:hypothetical protein